MENNVLKAMMALCLCGLLLVNVNVLFADVPPQTITDEGEEVENTDGGSNPGTPQQGKVLASKTTQTTTYVKLSAGGNWIVASVGAEGSVAQLTSVTWPCCKAGGNNCSTNNPDC